MSRRRTALFLVFLIGLGMLALIWFLRPKPVAWPPLPADNGYDDFMKAMETLDDNFSLWDWDKLNSEDPSKEAVAA